MILNEVYDIRMKYPGEHFIILFSVFLQGRLDSTQCSAEVIFNS